MIELGAEAAARAPDAGREHGHLEAQRAQQRGEKAVQLVAEAAAPPHDDLVEQRSLVEHDRPAQPNVQVLEGNRQQVRQVQRPQRLAGRLDRAAVGDAVEICRNIHNTSAWRLEIEMYH